jgi:hypothetical protein
MGAIDPTASLGGIQSAASQAQVTSIQGSLQSSSADAGSMTITSMDNLKNKYPDVYNAFMQAWASQIQSDMQTQNDNFIAEIKEEEEENS